MDRTKILIEHGFFPVQLPPSFSTKIFSEKYKEIEGVWNAQKPPYTRAEKYSVARSSYYRRATSIVNPIGYYFIAKEIDKHWDKIEKHYKQSKISLSRPEIKSGLRAIDISRFGDLYEAKLEKSSGYQYCLVTDITSYFPSIYTHSIPWAIHTKPVAKKNTGHSNEEFYGNIIDAKSMKLQEGQTMGIPIGPDTSHIISEIIGTSIDKDLKNALRYWPAGFRYVDDFFLFFNSRKEAEKALALLTKIVSNYELQLNPSKTRIIEVKDLVEESWKYRIRKLNISESKRQQKDDIHDYFECVFGLESKFKDESLVKYALKQISSSIVKKSNWSVFESYLFKCGYGFPNTLQTVVTILCTYDGLGYDLNRKAVERFCNNLIESHAVSDHHGEVSWLLWLCKNMRIPLKLQVVREIESMSSGVCKLMVMDLYHSKIIKYNLKVTSLKQISNSGALHSSDWLIAYEAGRRLWLKNSDEGFIKECHYFNALLKKNIYFYNESAVFKPIFEFKDKYDAENFKNVLDGDSDIHEYFEFDDLDEEYFDSNSHSGSRLVTENNDLDGLEGLDF